MDFLFGFGIGLMIVGVAIVLIVEGRKKEQEHYEKRVWGDVQRQNVKDRAKDPRRGLWRGR